MASKLQVTASTKLQVTAPKLQVTASKLQVTPTKLQVTPTKPVNVKGGMALRNGIWNGCGMACGMTAEWRDE